MSPRRLFAALALVTLVGGTAACTAPPTNPPGTWLAAGCLDGAGTDGAAAPDLLFNGTQNTRNNATFFATFSNGSFSLSGNGSCLGLPVGAVTIVRAADQATADTICTDLGAGAPATSFTGSAWTAPADAWSCADTATL